MSNATHDDLIRDQFTRQARAFNNAAPIANAAALKMVVDAATPGPEDSALDVACGGGLVARALAPHVRHVTGIDVTPAMLDQARQAAAAQGLTKISWDHGDVTRLPYATAAFRSLRPGSRSTIFSNPPRRLPRWCGYASPAGGSSSSTARRRRCRKGRRVQPPRKAARPVARPRAAAFGDEGALPRGRARRAFGEPL